MASSSSDKKVEKMADKITVTVDEFDGPSDSSPLESHKTTHMPIHELTKKSMPASTPEEQPDELLESEAHVMEAYVKSGTARRSFNIGRKSIISLFQSSSRMKVLNSSNADGSNDDPIFEEPIAPTLSLGERVAWVKTSGPEFGSVRWIGRMPQITNDWTVGVEFDNCIGSGDGTVDGRRYFVAKENFSKFLPLSALTKVDNYAGRPRSGTMLSRMSVQLKPGQLISIQRSPSIVIPHCSLNAPHHVGHDVHEINEKHCQCPSCNHPCAHICKTTKPKGRTRMDDLAGRPGLAHMCHFSSKPHAKMCCGGEDLPCATKPLMTPGISWMPVNDMASFRTVPTEPFFRRKSVTIHVNRKTASAPTSTERKPNSSPIPNDSSLKERRGSDLSISSLPSSGSPHVYIRRGVLTDESDLDSDTDRSYSPIFGYRSMAGLRSLVSCFSTNSSSLREKKRLKDKRRRRKRKQKRRTKAVFIDGRHSKKGLTSDSSFDLETTQSQSQNPTESIVSNISSSKTRTNTSPVQHKSESVSPTHPITHSPKEDKNAAKEPKEDKNIAKEPVPKENIPVVALETIEERRHRLDDEPISEGNEGQDGCTSSSKSSGHLITTKADIESTVNHRSPAPSSASTLSDSVSPRRRKKTSAPPPPPTASSSPASVDLSVSLTSLPQSPSRSSTPASMTRRRSYKKNPAPTPPNLTRSLSEQKQLNLKNMINAVPSFRSEVDLQGASRKSSPFEDSIERDDISLCNSIKNKEEVPLLQTDNFINDKCDAWTQT